MIDPKDLAEQIERIDGVHNKREFKATLREMLEGMQDVGRGFLRIAAAAKVIRDKEYYVEMGYASFDEFCGAVLGMTRKTIYLYLRIQTTIDNYPNLFDSMTVTQLGSAKMDKVIVGINRIERRAKSEIERNRTVRNLMKEITPTMSVGEIERTVKKIAPPDDVAR